MAKVPVAVRLEPEVLSSVDALAKARECSRQVLLEAWVSSGLEDARGGVVDLPAPDPLDQPVPPSPVLGYVSVQRPAPRRGDTAEDWAKLRQAKLNEGKYR